MKNNFAYFVKKYYQIIFAFIVFSIAIILKIPFYKIVIALLEIVIILEIIRMIDEFFIKHRISLRYTIDTFIIFLTRDVVLIMSKPEKNRENILFILLVIFIFFIFRIFALTFSPRKI